MSQYTLADKSPLSEQFSNVCKDALAEKPGVFLVSHAPLQLAEKEALVFKSGYEPHNTVPLKQAGEIKKSLDSTNSCAFWETGFLMAKRVCKDRKKAIKDFKENGLNLKNAVGADLDELSNKLSTEVKETTGGRFDSVEIPKSSDNVFYHLSVLSFDIKWPEKFEKDNTYFTTLDNQEVSVPGFFTTKKFECHVTSKDQTLIMRNGDLIYVAHMQTQDPDPFAYLGCINDPKKLIDKMRECTKQEAYVWLPDIDTQCSLEYNPPCQTEGLINQRTAFMQNSEGAKGTVITTFIQTDSAAEPPQPQDLIFNQPHMIAVFKETNAWWDKLNPLTTKLVPIMMGVINNPANA